VRSRYISIARQSLNIARQSLNIARQNYFKIKSSQHENQVKPVNCEARNLKIKKFKKSL
jgi:hypothetical protein